ncbi:MAG TPA: two-component regulator propeller domain-containing protein [Bacteroidota bacterium]|nr:two-component regulator propeller domain-containing protein [Bacteroidota bacterium]
MDVFMKKNGFDWLVVVVCGLALASCHTPTASDVIVIPPSVAITTPANNAQVADSTTITVKVTDNSAISRIEFYIDGAIDTTRTLRAAPYTSGWSMKNFADSSTHTLYVKAYDAASAVLTSPVVTILARKFAPTNLRIVTFNDSTLTLAWMNNGSLASIFYIEESVNGGAYTVIDSAAGGDTTVTIRKAFPNFNSYSFRIRGKNGAVLSGYSNLASAQPTVVQWTLFSTANSPLVSNAVNSLMFDAEGRLWVGTDNGASVMTNSGVWTNYTDSLKYGSGAMRVTSIAEGQDSSIWFALDGGGVARYRATDTTQWKRYTTPSIPANNVSSIVCDAANTGTGFVYCATLSGVGQYTPSTSNPGLGTWQTFNTSSTPPLPTNQTLTVAVDQVDHSLWIGTADGRLEYFNQFSTITNYSLPSGSSVGVHALAFDIHSEAWAGTDAGVSELNTSFGTWTANYTSSSPGSALPPGPVNAVATDKDTLFWFGTNSGLASLHHGTWTAFHAATSQIPSDSVTALVYDASGNLWVGTRKGIGEYNRNGFH